MRFYPVWDIVCDETYDSLEEALLAGRHLKPEDLGSGPEQLHAPELLADLERAAARIEAAVRRGEKIVVFGDYDADGVASTALLLDFLERIGAACDYVLPDRHKDGYGLKPGGVRAALERGAGLIVTVDNGISAFEAIEMAQGQGLDVVVVDHHVQLGELPPAHSIVNPQRRDCTYPFKGLAGVGVTFKVVQALSRAFMAGAERRRYLNQLLDLVALGTVADLVPVLGENRALIRRGLEVMEHSRRPGLRQLRAVARCAGGVTTAMVGFYLGPRLNVAGRLATPDLALRLLRAGEESEALLLAQKLEHLNSRRRLLQREGLKEAGEGIAPRDLDENRMLVLLGAGWKLGVIGLIAGKLAEQYARPVVVCSAERGDGLYVGSARSIPGYDISAGIGACAQYLESFGGHAGAAGFSLRAEHFEAFRAALIEHANARIAPEDMQPRLRVDMVIRPRDISARTLEILSRLEPFGKGHEAPVFAARDCRLVAAQRIGRDAGHLKLQLALDGVQCTALWWNRGEVAAQLAPGQRLSSAFELEADTYRGGGAVQLVLRDLYVQDSGSRA